MSARRRRRGPPAYSRWTKAQTACDCEFCQRIIAPGGWLLLIGPTNIRSCVLCARDRRGLAPPDGAVDETRDGRLEQLPAGDR